MLLHGWQTLRTDPMAFLAIVAALAVALLLGITVHEFSHAFIADRLGDSTPRRQGRVSLNPLAHLDPAGTLMMFLIGFGWGKPVQFDPRWLRNGRAGIALVAFAGPMANVVLAALLALVLRFYIAGAYEAPAWVIILLLNVLYTNIRLAAFNLIPVAPLDGSKIAIGLLPQPLAVQYLRYAPYLQVGLMVAIAADLVLNLNLIGRVINPFVFGLANILLGIE